MFKPIAASLSSFSFLIEARKRSSSVDKELEDFLEGVSLKIHRCNSYSNSSKMSRQSRSRCPICSMFDSSRSGSNDDQDMEGS